MRENADQENSKYGHFPRSAIPKLSKNTECALWCNDNILKKLA